MIEQKEMVIKGKLYKVTREYRTNYFSSYVAEFGRSSIQIECPFCKVVCWAYVWSLVGHGKRCSCGAMHIYMQGTYKDTKELIVK